jgi:hypothetical protein
MPTIARRCWSASRRHSRSVRPRFGARRRREWKSDPTIRHFTTGAELLGASPQLANDLLPYALAAHARLVRLLPDYQDARCKLPLWALPMSP